MNNPGSVLIVEDHPPMRRILRDAVQSALPSRELLEAENVAEAWALARAHRPGTVLMDIGLPDGNGLELTRQIKALLPRTVVVIVSNHITGAHQSHARAAGAAAYVAKDRLGEELLPALRTALAP